jgi:hypothetical protein
MLNVIMLNVVILRVFMLSDVKPKYFGNEPLKNHGKLHLYSLIALAPA